MSTSPEIVRQLTGELEEAQQEFKRCVGGIDPVGCVAASKRISELRNALRDDAALLAHFANLAEPILPSKTMHSGKGLNK